MSEPIRYPISDDLKRLMAGENETVFRILESRFCVSIQTRLPGLFIEAKEERSNIQATLTLLDQIKLAAQNGTSITGDWMRRLLEPQYEVTSNELESIPSEPILRNRYGFAVVPRTKNQYDLIKAVEKNDIIFAKGPAGTGKTFLAVALAVASLERHEAERICLVRPAVEAGESLGYLPGDLKEKIAPYLRPIHDSLAELLAPEKLKRYQETGAIEVAPLAYMRGRTLKRAFIILDEAQNTTHSQIKMFLTRLGHHSKVAITGDVTQKDLAKNQESGLETTLKILSAIKGISFVHFSKKDVVRHPLVIKIIEAFEHYEAKK